MDGVVCIPKGYVHTTSKNKRRAENEETEQACHSHTRCGSVQHSISLSFYGQADTTTGVICCLQLQPVPDLNLLSVNPVRAFLATVFNKS